MSDLNTHKPLLRFIDYSGNWINNKLKNLCVVNQGLQIPIAERLKEPTPTAKPYITIQFLNNSKEAEYVENPSDSVICNEDDILMTRTGNTGIVVSNVNGVFHNNFFKINYNRSLLNKVFLIETLGLPKIKKEILLKAGASTIPDLNHKDFYSISINFPSLEEQTKIATFLSAVDSKITSLERLVSHWQAYKKGIMQQIFTKQLRFKAPNGEDFPEWEPLTIEKVFHCLDNKRKPLNTSERLLIQGVIPYYGANGIVDYISDYIFDEELVLLAEDGGNFDDYKTRPIAQLVKGKCWVNNHAHVLKAKKGFSTTFLFYSLVHKDIRNHINGSSRSKLNKSDMLNIIINVPVIKEQTNIANFLSSIDDKIAHLQQQLTSYRQFKKALLQQMFV